MTNLRSAHEIQLSLEVIIAELRALETSKMAPAELVPLALSLKTTCDHAAKIDAEIRLRVLGNGESIPGVAVKDEIKHRQWHDVEAAEQLAQEQFGDAAFKRTLLSPAQMEKLGKDGATFVAMASFKPEAGKRVVY